MPRSRASDSGDPSGLKGVLTTDEPLGPEVSDEILIRPDLFKELYQSKSDLNSRLRAGMPAYVVGRKGAGKTAFLIGEAMSSGRDVVSVKASHAFTVVNVLRIKWEESHGVLPSDNLAYIWESILVHAAMRSVLANSPDPADEVHLPAIREYLAQIGSADPARPGSEAPSDSEDRFLAAVGDMLLHAVQQNGTFVPMRDVVLGVAGETADYRPALIALRQLLGQEDRRRLCVVVDNLEDLHTRLTGLEAVLAGLFRITSRANDPAEPLSLPFELRFAFPAEMVRKLREITANPEKDFRNHITVEWTASELHALLSIRIRKSLTLYFGETAVRTFQTEEGGVDIVRAVLPATDISNGLGGPEDPVAYLMRHTQLLPRHLIQIMNGVLSPMMKSGVLRRVTQEELISGVRTAETTIIEGILSSYLFDHPKLGESLRAMRNKIPFVVSQHELQSLYLQSGAKRLTGERYNEFLWAAMEAGVLGLKRSVTERYVIADFSYTYSDTLQPLPGDELCLHPLFVHVVHDPRSLDRIRMSGQLPIYPYGSDSGGDGAGF
jgi:hypothetical protein